MPLVTVLTRDPSVHRSVREPLEGRHSVAVARSWDRLDWLVRERPVTAVVLDSEALPDDVPEDVSIGELRMRYPSLAAVFAARPGVDPLSLFRLGRAGLAALVLMPVDDLGDGVRTGVGKALAGSTASLVTRTVSPLVPARETAAIRLALEGVQRGWGTEDLAGHIGLTRAHLSVRLRACGLPSAGHMLTWAKLLHAGRWLADPGRSAESVARQLEYSSGAAFRRALRNYVDATPTELRSGGGLVPVLRGFLDACGLGDSVQLDLSVV